MIICTQEFVDVNSTQICATHLVLENVQMQMFTLEQSKHTE